MSQLDGSAIADNSTSAGNPTDGSSAQPGQSSQSGAFSGLDADMRSFAENKGWHKDQNPVGAVLKSYKELESRLGSAVTLPAENDTEGWSKLYSRLGRPERPDAYSLPFAEQHDAAMAGKVRGMFHTAGLSQSQAEKLFSGYAELTAPLLEQQAAAENAARAEAAQVAKELGEQRMTAASGAYKRFMGNSPEDAAAMERVLGDGRMIRFFDHLAQVVGEDGKGGLGIGSSGGGREEKSNYLDIVTNAFNKTSG